MPKDTVFDPTDKGTLCPNAKLLRKKGDAFYLIKLPDFSQEITLLEHVSPDDLITLFMIYYTLEIIDLIVEKTNKYMREPQGGSCPYAQANAQYLICCKEIYIYFAICIYMTLYICNKISDYQDTREFMLIYPILIEMLKNWF